MSDKNKTITLSKRVVLFEKTKKEFPKYTIIQDRSSVFVVYDGNTTITFESKTAKEKQEIN